MYVFVREDLSWPQKVVQSCHAVMEMSRHHLSPNEEHPSVVLIGVKSKEKLKQILGSLNEQSVVNKEFYEPLFDNEITAIATEPITEDRRRIFKKYQLLKSKEQK